MRRQAARSLAVCAAALVLDQLGKRLASADLVRMNPGLIFGMGPDLPAWLRVVALSSCFGFIFFAYLCCLYLLSARMARLKVGLGLLVGGIAGNVVDKALLGSTVDFIPLPLGFAHIVFNPADAFQWLGAAVIAHVLFTKGDQLWFPDDNRGSYLVRPREQLWFAAKFASISFSACLVLGLFSYPFLRLASGQMPASQAQGMLLAFGLTHLGLSALFTLVVFLVGLVVSHRSYGPFYAFEQYVEELLQGGDRDFTLRDGDHFQHLIEVANKLRGRLK